MNGKYGILSMENVKREGPVNYKFEVGDQVRISKMKRTFEKGYLPNFSKEIFTVSQQIPRHPPVVINSKRLRSRRIEWNVL